MEIKMGKPKKVEPTLLDTNYNWGQFGSADKNGFYLNDTAQQNLNSSQEGLYQYVNELINPSYYNTSFVNRQAQIDQNNQEYARQLGQQAIARGYRGTATQNILNSLNANRNANMQQALVDEDARVRNIISKLSGIEGNYWNQGNAMANNIMQRYTTNVARQNEANATNVANYNAWRDNLFSGTGGLVGSAIGAYFGGPVGAAIGGQAGSQAGSMVENAFS